jgi:hypothetical protein
MMIDAKAKTSAETMIV